MIALAPEALDVSQVLQFDRFLMSPWSNFDGVIRRHVDFDLWLWALGHVAVPLLAPITWPGHE